MNIQIWVNNLIGNLTRTLKKSKRGKLICRNVRNKILASLLQCALMFANRSVSAEFRQKQNFSKTEICVKHQWQERKKNTLVIWFNKITSALSKTTCNCEGRLWRRKKHAYPRCRTSSRNVLCSFKILSCSVDTESNKVQISCMRKSNSFTMHMVHGTYEVDLYVFFFIKTKKYKEAVERS